MKRQYLFQSVLGLCILILSLNAYSQHTLSGSVSVKQSNERLQGATIVLDDGLTSTTSNANGEYKLDNIPSGNHSLKVSVI